MKILNLLIISLFVSQSIYANDIQPGHYVKAEKNGTQTILKIFPKSWSKIALLEKTIVVKDRLFMGDVLRDIGQSKEDPPEQKEGDVEDSPLFTHPLTRYVPSDLECRFSFNGLIIKEEDPSKDGDMTFIVRSVVLLNGDQNPDVNVINNCHKLGQVYQYMLTSMENFIDSEDYKKLNQ